MDLKIMNDDDLIRIKNFVRVCFEIEQSLNVSWLQKKILLKVIELWGAEHNAPIMSELVISVDGLSNSSVQRHLKSLFKKGWLKVTLNRQDQRIKHVEPSQKLLKLLALKV